jgi:DNA invertase Pin-like site-specific DNA recombinase
MARKPEKVVRCAIYTRKSTEHGLELEFNSLDAQREACEAYIKSQVSQGWQVLPKRYDDPAFSGGNLDRPALQTLLKDIEAKLVDVVVVYKIDRLTRSLADFAKLVEIFEAKSVSFVAVTQQFNTTTSMGRLTLNVLLSFAQFERELASERVKDKIAASRKRGKWTGGSIPLGYDVKDKRLVVNAAEAKTVRLIFTRYLVLKSFQKLIDELNHKGIFTKKRPVAGKVVGGIPFTYGPLAYLLRNRTYLGETGHNGHRFAGEHEPIIERGVFEQVQRLLKTNSAGRRGRRHMNGALLTGLLFDDRGNRMSPSFSTKRGVRYPFYVSSALVRGRKKQAGSISRVSAAEIEAAVMMALRTHTQDYDESITDLTPHNFVEQKIARVVVQDKILKITLKASSAINARPIEAPWSPTKKRNLIQIEGGEPRATPRANLQLVQTVVRAHAWLELLSAGTYDSIESLAKVIKQHPKVIRSRIRFAFLAPAITTAILNGRQPAALMLGNFDRAVPMKWGDQQARFLHSDSRYFTE